MLKDQDIPLIALRNLTANDLIAYFRTITKSCQITGKCFNDLKSIMNGILYLAVENDIIERKKACKLSITPMMIFIHSL